jgi:hypothetical protein
MKHLTRLLVLVTALASMPTAAFANGCPCGADCPCGSGCPCGHH